MPTNWVAECTQFLRHRHKFWPGHVENIVECHTAAGLASIFYVPAEYVATLSADTPGALCDLHLLLLTGCGNAMWAHQSFTGLHIWDMEDHLCWILKGPSGDM